MEKAIPKESNIGMATSTAVLWVAALLAGCVGCIVWGMEVSIPYHNKEALFPSKMVRYEAVAPSQEECVPYAAKYSLNVSEHGYSYGPGGMEIFVFTCNFVIDEWCYPYLTGPQEFNPCNKGHRYFWVLEKRYDCDDLPRNRMTPVPLAICFLAVSIAVALMSYWQSYYLCNLVDALKRGMNPPPISNTVMMVLFFLSLLFLSAGVYCDVVYLLGAWQWSRDPPVPW